jgi:hypothetical protein
MLARLAIAEDYGRREAILAGKLADQRRHKRVQISLGVRFMLPSGEELRGSVLDISAGGISVQSDTPVEMGSAIIIYVDEIGRVEGQVVRAHEQGFAVQFNLPQTKREKIVETLTVLTNKDKLEGADLRRHERVNSEGSTRIVLPDGREIACRILDLSLSGVSLETRATPLIGEEVMVGRMRGRVARIHERGIAIEFVDVPQRGSLADQLTHRPAT